MTAAGTIVLIIFLLAIAAGIGWIVYTRIRASQLGVSLVRTEAHLVISLSSTKKKLTGRLSLAQLPPPPLRSYVPFLKSSPSPYGPPQPAPGGIVGWVNDRIRMFKAGRNSRTAAGAYEGAAGSSSARSGRRGFGPLDPDDAWDSRVGAEADTFGPGGYYEEQELGLAPGLHGATDTGYAGAAASSGGGASYPMNLAATPGDGPAGYENEERGRTRSRSPGRHLAASDSRGNPFDDDAEPSNISLRGVSPRPIDTAAANSAARSGQKDKDSPTERRSAFREDM